MKTEQVAQYKFTDIDGETRKVICVTEKMACEWLRCHEDDLEVLERFELEIGQTEKEWGNGLGTMVDNNPRESMVQHGLRKMKNGSMREYTRSKESAGRGGYGPWVRA